MKRFCVSKFEIRNLAYTKLCNGFIFYIFYNIDKKGKMSPSPKSLKCPNGNVPNRPKFIFFQNQQFSLIY